MTEAPAVMLLPGVDAPNIELPHQHPAFVTVPFHALTEFYNGELILPDAEPCFMDQMIKSREFYGNLDLKTDIPEGPLSRGVTLGAHYPNLNEVIGRRIDVNDQPVLIIYVQSVQDGDAMPMMLIDFTRKIDREVIPVMEHPGVWDARVEENLPRMKAGKGLDLLPQHDHVYCVASGPSLLKNKHLLPEAKKTGAIIGLNEVLQVVPAELVDYYLCIDMNSPAKWWENVDCSKTTLIAGPYVPPEMLDHNWRDVLWFVPAGCCTLRDHIRTEAPHLPTLVAPGSVGPTSVTLAHQMRPSTVILVGHSYCYELIKGEWWQTVAEKITPEAWGDMLTKGVGGRGRNEFCFVENVFGVKVPTWFPYLDAAMHTIGVAQLMKEVGIRVINATEGGLLRENRRLAVFRDEGVLERMDLEEAIRLLERGDHSAKANAAVDNCFDGGVA